MAYTAELASKLSGASMSQLLRLRQNGVLIPEHGSTREVLYSYRDVVALRSIMWLRSEFSLQQIRKVISYLDRVDLGRNHLAEIQFATVGRDILVRDEDGFTDVLAQAGTREIAEPTSLKDIFAPFRAYRGRAVPDFQRPSEHLTIDPDRMGGLPVVEGTRIPFDTIAQLVDFDTIHPDDVAHYFPRVNAAQALDAVEFARSLSPEKVTA